VGGTDLVEAGDLSFATNVVIKETGGTYILSYRNQTWNSTFKGWTLDGGEPSMNWVDTDGRSWEAYLYRGVVSVGTSADPLSVLGKVS